MQILTTKLPWELYTMINAHEVSLNVEVIMAVFSQWGPTSLSWLPWLPTLGRCTLELRLQVRSPLFVRYFATAIKIKLGVVVHAFNPRTWEVEAGRSLWTQGQPCLYSSILTKSYLVRHCLKTKQNTQIHAMRIKKTLKIFFRSQTY